MYIPGFSNMLMRPENMGGPTRATLPGVQPSAPPIMAQPVAPAAPVRPSAPPVTGTPAAAPQVPGLRLFGEQSAAQSDFQLSDEMLRNALRTMPGAARPDFNAVYTKPSLNPSLDFRTLGDQQGYYFTTNAGRAAKTKASPSGFVALNPNAQYRLVNERGKNQVVASGTGEGGLQSAYQIAQQLSAEQGKKADWKLEVFDPAVGKWVVQADDDPKGSILGTIADIALPLAGAVLLPGVGGALGGALGAGLGAAGGSTLSSVAQGRSLGDTLMRAGLSGVTAGGLSAASGAPFIPAGAPSGALGGAAAGSALGAGTMAQAGLQAAGLRSLATPGITVLGNAAGAGIGSAGAALGSAAGSALGAAATGGEQAPAPTPAPAPTLEPEIVVERPALPAGFDPGSIAPVLPNLIPSVAAPTPDVSPEIVVERDRAPTSFEEPPAALPPVAPDFTNLPQPDVSVPEPEKSFLDKLKENLGVTDYLRLAALGVGLLSGGGGGRGALGTIPGGLFGGGSGVFSGGLPAATLPGASTNFAPRTADDLGPQTTQDWYRYGYGPEQSFFGYVPKGEENTSQAYTGYALGGMAGGGDMRGMPRDSFAVNGPGTGRSDEIPAMLSDGEYVMDAESVALLGDGSSKAGADRLDELRVNLRKHKGQKLAQGDFSVNAKRPEQYLKGGRA